MRATILLIVLFILSLAAGAVTGRLAGQQPSSRSQRPATSGGSPLADELQLSSEQRDQMRPSGKTARDTARAAPMKRATSNVSTRNN